MAWRDPFLFEGPGRQLHAVWSAKLSPHRAGHCPCETGARRGGQIRLAELRAPIALPDAHLMTQAEVPKVYRDPSSGDFLLLVSACDRRFEGPPDRELTHIHRLYRSRELHGPWMAFGDGASALPGLDRLFGGSLVVHDASTGRFSVLAPRTENAGPERQLRFAGVVDVRVQPGTLGERAGPA